MKVEVEDQEIISHVASPTKRKERFISSLTVYGPRVSIHKFLTKKENKAPCRRGLSLVCSICFHHCAIVDFVSTFMCRRFEFHKSSMSLLLGYYILIDFILLSATWFRHFFI